MLGLMTNSESLSQSQEPMVTQMPGLITNSESLSQSLIPLFGADCSPLFSLYPFNLPTFPPFPSDCLCSVRLSVRLAQMRRNSFRIVRSALLRRCHPLFRASSCPIGTIPKISQSPPISQRDFTSSSDSSSRRFNGPNCCFQQESVERWNCVVCVVRV